MFSFLQVPVVCKSPAERFGSDRRCSSGPFKFLLCLDGLPLPLLLPCLHSVEEKVRKVSRSGNCSRWPSGSRNKIPCGGVLLTLICSNLWKGGSGRFLFGRLCLFSNLFGASALASLQTKFSRESSQSLSPHTPRRSCSEATICKASGRLVVPSAVSIVRIGDSASLAWCGIDFFAFACVLQ
jgi:hypothetical protein